MWSERDALDALALPSRERVLDVGCGTGELAAVFAEESDAEVLALDADKTLLSHVDADGRLLGDATQLPSARTAATWSPARRCSSTSPTPSPPSGSSRGSPSDLVAAVEPDNAAVTVDSTVAAESALTRRAREAYAAGVPTDVSLGADAADVFERAGLEDVTTTRYDHVRAVEPPYDEDDLEAAARKATGERLAEQRPTLAAGGMDDDAYDDLRAEWREMGARSSNRCARTPTSGPNASPSS